MDKVLKSFIVFEGLDGAGTTTQTMNLARYYEFNRREYFLTREPTDNPIGQLVRQVLQKKVATTPEALALLYAADRHDHLFSESHGIARMAEEGRIVISDRYFYSSIAYQSVECDPGFIRLINAFPSPEFIIFVDTPVEECLARIEKRGEARELFDRGEFRQCMDHFLAAIHSRYDIEKPTVKRFISHKLHIINRLRQQNEELRNQIAIQQKLMNQYAEEYYELGNASILQAHNSRAAIANYDKALSLNPQYVDAYIRKGITLQNGNDFDGALQCFNQAARLSTANFKVHYNRGKNHLLCGRMEQAVSDLDKAVSLKPDHAKAHELFGDALSRSGKEEEAAIQWAIAEALREKRRKG